MNCIAMVGRRFEVEGKELKMNLGKDRSGLDDPEKRILLDQSLRVVRSSHRGSLGSY